MSKTDIFEGRYRYYAYPIDEKHFNEGLQIKTKKLEHRINSLAFNEQGLQEWLNSNYNTYCSKFICILKIPTHYFGHVKSEERLTPCMPLIYTHFDYVNGEKNYINPGLILGIFNIETREYEENPYYNPIVNPIGLQFTDEQIASMKTCYNPNTADYALARRNIPYEVLRQQDELSGVFNSTIEYYYALVNNKSKENKHILEKKPN